MGYETQYCIFPPKILLYVLKACYGIVFGPTADLTIFYIHRQIRSVQKKIQLCSNVYLLLIANLATLVFYSNFQLSVSKLAN